MVTHKRKLRGGTPLWLAGAPPASKVRQNVPRLLWDVAVIGAGITGALISYQLAKAGCRVLILDRRPPLRGSTAASTALIQWDIDRTLTELAERLGLARAREIHALSLAAVRKLRLLVRNESINCGWQDREALYLAGDAHGWRALKQEAGLREKCGLPSQFIEQSELRESHGFSRTGAILSRIAGEADPVRLARGLLARAQRLGAMILSPAEVVACQSGKSQVALLTRDGRAFEARRAIFATGYETLKQIPRDSYSIISTWAVATEPVAPADFWPERKIVWEASDPYLYLRSTQDNRIVAGGEDEPFQDEAARDRLIAAKATAILAKLREMLPGRTLRIAYRWAGNFAETADGLPIIAEPAGLPRCLAVLGAGGNGITFSMIASDIARDWARGRKAPGATLFEPR